MKTRVRKALLLVNTFGALGYLTMALAWTLFICVLLFLFMQSSIDTVPTVPETQAVTGIGDSEVVFTRVIAYVITAVMAVLSVVIFFLLPYLIGKWGAKIMRLAMKWCRVDVTRRNLFLTKGVVLMVPLLGFIILNLVYVPPDMTIPMVHISTVFLALLSLACFLMQLVSARSFNVDTRSIW